MKASSSKSSPKRTAATESVSGKSPDKAPVSGGVAGPALVDMYRLMVRMRKFEERCYQIYLQRKIGGLIDDIVRALPSGSFKVKKA